MLKRSRTSIPTFSPAANSADLSSTTRMTIDTMTKQKESFDVETDEVIKAATVGLSRYLFVLLQKQSKQNAFTISKYVLAMIAEINPSTSYIENQIKTLCYLSDSIKQKPFSKLTRDDILGYLDSHRRSEESDPSINGSPLIICVGYIC